ncbi:gephyrin-like molybdotransferase Glp [Glaciecola sp. MF2-115]|uniref:molybdopterin molybdotransferase MoeA n=1 Tax=Glaciecola sp. MF2-115 TaxID=3384827 RepID=UPI0039A3CFDD
MNCACDAPGLMPIEHAMEMIRDTISPISEVTQCPLSDALDRVIAQDIISPINVPAYDNSAMDGYALRYADFLQSKTLKQVGKSLAGNSFEGEIKAGECVRIMTGAEIPTGADTVVMQENTSANELEITFLKASMGDAIRPAGDDIKKGAVVLQAGARISPIDIGLLASLGFASVPVFRQLKVAVFSTGDELLAVGNTPRDDRIFDTNRPMLVAMLSKLGAEVFDLGIIPDSKDQIRAAFEQANALADCVVTSGGVSVGEADYTREILEEYGSIDFWKLAIKPGKPLAFGSLPNSIFFGLPGNPVSSAVTFDQIAAPALAYLAGCKTKKVDLLPAIAATPFRKRPGRTDYQRAFYFVNENGELNVETTGSQSSGVLSCFRQSNCYAVLENERGKVNEGEIVHILPFTNIISSV